MSDPQFINQGTNAAQAAEYRRIAAKIDTTIPIYAMPGNHDVENEPTPASLATYARAKWVAITIRSVREA